MSEFLLMSTGNGSKWSTKGIEIQFSIFSTISLDYFCLVHFVIQSFEGKAALWEMGTQGDWALQQPRYRSLISLLKPRPEKTMQISNSHSSNLDQTISSHEFPLSGCPSLCKRKQLITTKKKKTANAKVAKISGTRLLNLECNLKKMEGWRSRKGLEDQKNDQRGLRASQDPCDCRRPPGWFGRLRCCGSTFNC